MDIKNKSQFIKYFTDGIKKTDQLKIGVEHERFLFEGKNSKPLDVTKVFSVDAFIPKLKLSTPCFLPYAATATPTILPF